MKHTHWSVRHDAGLVIAEWAHIVPFNEVSSAHKVPFKCSKCGYIWHAVIWSRLPGPSRPKGRGCPKCAAHGPAKTGCTWKTWLENPRAKDLLKEWADRRQLETVSSRTVVRWRCSAGHVWFCRIMNRLGGQICRLCNNLKRVANGLAPIPKPHSGLCGRGHKIKRYVRCRSCMRIRWRKRFCSICK